MLATSGESEESGVGETGIFNVVAASFSLGILAISISFKSSTQRRLAPGYVPGVVSDLEFGLFRQVWWTVVGRRLPAAPARQRVPKLLLDITSYLTIVYVNADKVTLFRLTYFVLRSTIQSALSGVRLDRTPKLACVL